MIVTFPALTPVTTPFLLTVATVLSLVLYVTVAVEGLTVVLIVTLFPTVTFFAAFTVRDGFLTVTVAFNVLFTCY